MGEYCLKPPFLGYRCWYLEWNKEDVMRAARKGVKEIRTFSRFSEEAIRYAERFRPGIRLVQGNNIVKPRRRKARLAVMT